MPKIIWKAMTLGPRLIYRLGLGGLIGNRILMLTTTGRRSGLERNTPLQYERMEDNFIIGSARGLEADWVKNIQAKPEVRLQVGRRKLDARGKVFADKEVVARFLQQRYENHPLFVKLIFLVQGIRGELNFETFLEYAEKRVMVVLEPIDR